ncbi:MAG: hypothetical protein C0506_08925 [Anaerolinea sp.]|nr:hypothetical protein [Anaerolinea sp.]
MYKSVNEIKAAAAEAGGVLTVTMEQLREAHDYGRLGPHVKKSISDSLAKNGLGYFPQLGDYQHETTRVYQLGTPVADLISAVLNPTSANDVRLRKAAGGEDAEVLAKIRALVCE